MPTLTASFGLVPVLALFYVAFLFWYGGRGQAMTVEEVNRRLGEISATTGGKSQAVDPAPGEILD